MMQCKFKNGFLRIAGTVACIFFAMQNVTNIDVGAQEQASNTPLGPIGFYNSEKREQTLAISGTNQLRFITTIDFPPFGFTDGSGKLSGFHLELARLICDNAGISDTCSIQSAPFEEIESLLELGQVDAVLAGHQVTRDMRTRFAFSQPYFRWPHRFLTKPNAGLNEPLATALLDKNVGVMTGTIHEAVLRSFFKATTITGFTDETELHDALKNDEVDAIYGDGVTLGFYQLSAAAENCCQFAGGAYFANGFRSDVMTIMMNRDRRDVQETVRDALRSIQRDGKLDELLLRWFPFDLYGQEDATNKSAG